MQEAKVPVSQVALGAAGGCLFWENSPRETRSLQADSTLKSRQI